MSKKEKIYNPEWDKYADLWGGLSYPWRPNLKQIAFYKKYLKQYLTKKPKAKILIFGCTPETRDLCSKLKLPVTLFDFNDAMYHGMIKLMKQKPYKEKFVQGKWEDVSGYFKEDEFDVIFADEMHCNVLIKLWDKNIKDISKILKKDGLFFFSNITMNFDKTLTIKEVFKKYKNDKKYFSSFKNKVDVFYQMCLGEDCYNWELRGIELDKIRNKFKIYAKKNKVSMETMKKIWFDPKDIEKEVYKSYVEVDPPMGEVYEFLTPYFWVEDFYVDKTHPVYRFRRDLILKPKK
ncbi:methyltransferase domain-containing protein [Candidatus Falkowbacteria bacterium]|jgi:hypothetical protein|nr:methyltransferase domain-containing protein [Candidatus Falkowbacteria bacterium]MBT4433131.1 methyltransferase domain-containing protein [Candidatus Falkowbacteria bacterium]